MNEIIRIENLTHTYGEGTPFRRSAVENLSLDIYRGEFLGLIGHTGSGKSTLIQHLNGLLKPTGGRVLLDGEDIWADQKKIRSVRFRVGLVFQYPEYQLFEETVYRDIAFGPTNMGLTGAELDRRVHDAARFAGLDEGLLQKSPFALSGGQKRRVAIAGVIAMRPGVLILDEPTAGLDPAGCRQIMDNIRDYRERTGSTVIVVSHSMDDVARFTERLIVFDHSHVVMDGTPAEVFSQPEKLCGIGLAVPQATRIAMALKARGIALPGSIYTYEQLKAALLELKGVDIC